MLKKSFEMEVIQEFCPENGTGLLKLTKMSDCFEKTKKVYVFDMDGTLVSSVAFYTKAYLSILDEEGIPCELEFMNELTPLGYNRIARTFLDMGVPGTMESVMERMDGKLIYEYTHNIKLKPFVREYLHKLKSEGADLYVLTGSPHHIADACLQKNGVYELFDRIWTTDDYGLAKTGPELFVKVAEQIGCQMTDVHYFDDNPIAVMNARKAGYQVFGVLDVQNETEAKQLKQNCHVFVESFEKLL